MIGFLSSLVWNYAAIRRPHNAELRNRKGWGEGGKRGRCVQRLTETGTGEDKRDTVRQR